jgi:hypothetical protein
MEDSNLMKVVLRITAPLLLFAALATAGPIAVDAGWYGFCFGGTPGSPATAGCQNLGIGTAGNSMTFTASGPVTLQVTDAFAKGDMFDVNVNSVFAFTTSSVPTASSSTTDPNVAFADPTYSHGSITLGAGVYSVDIFTNTSPYQGGGAYVSVVSAVPEPAAWLLLASGLGLLTVRRRFRA